MQLAICGNLFSAVSQLVLVWLLTNFGTPTTITAPLSQISKLSEDGLNPISSSTKETLLCVELELIKIIIHDHDPLILIKLINKILFVSKRISYFRGAKSTEKVTHIHIFFLFSGRRRGRSLFLFFLSFSFSIIFLGCFLSRGRGVSNSWSTSSGC